VEIELLTTENLPENLMVLEVFGLLQYTGFVEISEKGMLRRLFDQGGHTHQDVLDEFVALAPEEANAIIGIKVSTATQFHNDRILLCVTYIGNPAILVERE